MPRSKRYEVDADFPRCSVERALNILGDRWSFLILRESLLHDVDRFQDFERRLGIATNVLSDRLEAMVGAGILDRAEYQEPGSRSRAAYVPTSSGRSLILAIAALQQWGDEFAPREDGPTVKRSSISSGGPVRVSFVNDAGHELDRDDVRFEPSNRLPASVGTSPIQLL